jgi:hypothetical protein
MSELADANDHPARLIVVVAFSRADNGQLVPAYDPMQFDTPEDATRMARYLAGNVLASWRGFAMYSLMWEAMRLRRSCFNLATYRSWNNHQAIKMTWEATVQNLVKIGAAKITRCDEAAIRLRRPQNPQRIWFWPKIRASQERAVLRAVMSVFRSKGRSRSS